MKRILLLLTISLFFVGKGMSQLLTWTAPFITESNTPIVITMDATKGNQGLQNYATPTDVYVHTAVITTSSTTPSDWRYVKFNQNFNAINPSLQAGYNASFPNKWTFTITGGIRAYYGVPAGETILKIAILFRSGNGSVVQRNSDGSDMYIPVYNNTLATRLAVPPKQPTFIPKAEPINKVVGNNVAITGLSNNPANLKLYFNGNVIQTATNATSIAVTPGPVITSSGTQTIIVEANDGVTTKYDTIKFYVAGTVNVAALPAGLRDGINYEANTAAATFVLYAPFKNRVSVIGDLPGSNWDEQTIYQMNKTPDGNYWWLRVTGLTPGTEYSFQYLIDGTLRVSDPYVEKVLDPWNDQFISAETYPNLKPYPTGFTSGIVGILQTASPSYNWTTTNYTRPNKKNLIIYELHLRDFIGKHDWKTMRDTINYLKKLGINAIQFMPINEFEGNNSWGYNPDFYFAPDKYYGPKNDLKQFIDLAHSKGMAVIIDIALNHSFGLSPMVQMYWDAANNRPAANSPWFNPVAKHGFNVGYDMNHESLATRYFTSRVVEHWLVNYKIDGFRFDLSKGFTQTQTCDNNGNNCNVGSWSSYDASRVAIWKRYYDTLQLKSPGSYVILEHFATNSEELELSNSGMLLWGNMNNNYGQASMGYSSDWDLSYGIATQRGWSQPHLITFMESHDEERIGYKNISFGNVSAFQNVKDTNVSPRRMELAHAFLLTIPGPKMIWQFGELGYDTSITWCQNGTLSTNCRTDPKPIRWGYNNDTERKNLYNVIGNINRLRVNPTYSNMFMSNNITYNLGGAFKTIIMNDPTAKMVVIGNFDVFAQTGSVTFPAAGTWYNFLNAGTFFANGGSQSFTLQPGEYRIYLNQFAPLPVNLISFNGKQLGIRNELRWDVENEINLGYYELERSIDGRNFDKVAKITATGNRFYNFVDDIGLLSSNVFFYRLKMIDNDGAYRYSAIVKLSSFVTAGFVEVTPNPFGEKLVVRIESPNAQRANLILTDISGRRLLGKQVQLQQGNNVFEIPEVAGLSKGIYMLTVVQGDNRRTIKVIKGD